MDYEDERTPVVRVVVQREDGKILLARKEEIQKWELPGGKIEEDENRFEAARRELEEETGIESSEFYDMVRVEIEDENGCANAYIIYTDSHQGSAEPTSHEHDEVKWVDQEDYPDQEFHYHSAYSVPAVRRMERYLSDREKEKVE